jgi:O-antigen/teichoic acid export membrane protein
MRFARLISRAPMARNTGSMFVGQFGKGLLQGAYFVIIARALGVAGFGAFSGTVALVALIAPFASLGAINLTIKHIAIDRTTAAAQFNAAVKVVVLAAAVVTVLLMATAVWLAPRQVSLGLVLCIALADLFFSRLIELAGAVFLACEQMLQTAAFQLWLNGARLAGAIALLVTPWQFTPLRWAEVYLGTSAAATIACIAVTRRRFGRAKGDLAQFRREWREGILFSVSLASQTVYNDIDKAMLARLSTLDATGIYTAAYRIVDMAFTPMRALLGAAYPRFFQHGARGMRSALGFARKLAIPGVGYCLTASVGLLVGADLIPVILGPSYHDSVGALRGLAVLPVLKAAHYLAADALTGAGYQGMRSSMQIAIAVGNVLLNLALIPTYGYRGAIVASLLSDGLLAVLLWGVVLIKLRLNASATRGRETRSS